MKTIEIIVSPKGESLVETKGFAGESCREASKFIEQALGTKVSEQKTAEFYNTTQVENDLRNSSGS